MGLQILITPVPSTIFDLISNGPVKSQLSNGPWQRSGNYSINAMSYFIWLILTVRAYFDNSCFQWVLCYMLMIAAFHSGMCPCNSPNVHVNLSVPQFDKYSTNHVYLHRPKRVWFLATAFAHVLRNTQNAFRTFLNWLKNSKRVWHEPKLHILRLPLFANFDL